MPGGYFERDHIGVFRRKVETDDETAAQPGTRGCIEQAMRDEMARQVGAKPGASDSIIALGALRMVHDMFAKATEKTINVFLPKYGYEVDGFSDSLKDPTVREATDACLVEIARESDILQYVQSPWANQPRRPTCCGDLQISLIWCSVLWVRPTVIPSSKHYSRGIGILDSFFPSGTPP